MTDRRAIKQGAVLYDTRTTRSRLDPASDRSLCHVVNVFEDVHTGDRLYQLWDGTHTYREYVHEDTLAECFQPAGWTWPTGRKPLYHLTRICGVDDEADLMSDGGVAVGSYGDLEPDRGQPVDRNPSVECRICGESFHWGDYWAPRIFDAENPEDVPLWCDDCEEEIQTLRRRLSDNEDLSQWGGGDGE